MRATRKVVTPKHKPLVKTHSRAFAITGLVIVLLTFLVKEVFQEKLKDLRDSIAEAERTEAEASRDDSAVLDGVQMNMRLGEIQNQLAAARIGGTVQGRDLRDEISDTVQVLVNTEQRFDRVSKMLDKLPGNTEALKVKRDGLNHDLADLKNEVADGISKSQSAKSQGPMNHILVLAEMLQVLVFDLKLLPLQMAVTETTKRVGDADEALYDKCNYTYWTLHLIGWGIMLIGVILGMKSPED
ncbi:MAG: hypothetical protein ABSD67_20640 [Terracidiphilus sp.]|jgi:hypothetical protein